MRVIALRDIGARPVRLSDRGCGGCAGAELVTPPKLQVSLGYRWFRADHHFVGDEEQKYREREHSQTINSINLYDVGIATTSPHDPDDGHATLEVMGRSQVVRNSGGTILDRFTTETAGLRDLRLTSMNGFALLIHSSLECADRLRRCDADRQRCGKGCLRNV